eukprot:COSAG03_NODE_1221_length_4528_cov_6.191240_4_plen_79_part_00
MPYQWVRKVGTCWCSDMYGTGILGGVHNGAETRSSLDPGEGLYHAPPSLTRRYRVRPGCTTLLQPVPDIETEFDECMV